jgi:F0F1-type ATP synthase assembly protein I
MDKSPQHRPDLHYFAMIQIGMEMAAPVALGVWLDHAWDCLPWLTVVGAVLGLALGLLEVSRIGSGGRKEKDADDVRKSQRPGDEEK